MSTDPTNLSNAACRGICSTRQNTGNRGAWIYGSLRELKVLENSIEALTTELQALKTKVNNLPTGVEYLYELDDCDDDLVSAESGTMLIRNADGSEWTKTGLDRIAIGNGTDNTITAQYTTAIGFLNTGNAHTLGNNSIGAIAIGVGAASTVGVVGNNSGAIAIGITAGEIGQATRAISLGYQAGNTNQGIGAISIGDSAGLDAQGYHAIAIGTGAGRNSQAETSIVINASGSIIDNTTPGTCKITPIRGSTAQAGSLTNFIPPVGFNLMAYNPTTKEVSYYVST